MNLFPILLAYFKPFWLHCIQPYHSLSNRKCYLQPSKASSNQIALLLKQELWPLPTSIKKKSPYALIGRNITSSQASSATGPLKKACENVNVPSHLLLEAQF